MPRQRERHNLREVGANPKGVNGVGPFALAQAVVGLAQDNVKNYLERGGREADAVASWAWLIGLHGFRLDARSIYESTDVDLELVESRLREMFEAINADRFARIDSLARKAKWVLRNPTPGELNRRNFAGSQRYETHDDLVDAVSDACRFTGRTTREIAAICDVVSSTVQSIVKHDPRFVVASKRGAANLWKFQDA